MRCDACQCERTVGGHDWKFAQKLRSGVQGCVLEYFMVMIAAFWNGKKGWREDKPNMFACLKHFFFAKCMRARMCMEKVYLGHLNKGKEGVACDGRNPIELLGTKCAQLR